jgi:hypothetical protein
MTIMEAMPMSWYLKDIKGMSAKLMIADHAVIFAKFTFIPKGYIMCMQKIIFKVYRNGAIDIIFKMTAECSY